VRIGETHNLPGVAGVRKNFLVSGEAGIKNDFTAAARDGASRAAVKCAPVLEREYGGSVLNVRQWILRQTSFVAGLGCGQGTEVVDGPVGKHRAAVNKLAGDWTEDARIVGTDAMVAHNEIAAARKHSGRVVADVGILRRDVGLGDFVAVDIDDAAANFHGFSGKGDYPLDERFRAIQRIPEDDDVTAVDGFEAIDEFIDEDALLIGEQRGHAGAFDFDWLVEENNDDQGKADGDEEIAGPDANFVAQQMMWRNAGSIG